MFKPVFSLAFVLIGSALFVTVIGIAWWTGHYPTAGYRFVIGVMALFVAHVLEADLARRYERRKRLPSPHRKTTA